MNPFEYIMIPTGIIVGLALAHLLAGLGKTLFRFTGHGEPIKPSWVHLLWVLNTGFWVVAYWFYTFNRSAEEIWSLGAYLLLIPTPIVMYLQCVVLYPHSFDRIGDVGEYFLDVRRWFYGLYIAATVVDFADGWAGHWLSYLVNLGGSYVTITALSLAIPIAGMLTRNMRAHAGLGVLMLAAQLWQMFNDHPVLGNQLPGG